MSIEYHQIFHQILSQIQRCGNTETGHANFAPPIKPINIFEPEKFLPQGCNKIGTFLFSPSPKDYINAWNIPICQPPANIFKRGNVLHPPKPHRIYTKTFSSSTCSYSYSICPPDMFQDEKKSSPRGSRFFHISEGPPLWQPLHRGVRCTGVVGAPTTNQHRRRPFWFSPSPLLPRKRLSWGEKTTRTRPRWPDYHLDPLPPPTYTTHRVGDRGTQNSLDRFSKKFAPFRLLIGRQKKRKWRPHRRSRLAIQRKIANVQLVQIESTDATLPIIVMN